MRVLLDTDVLMDVALGRPEFGPSSRRVLECFQQPSHTAVVAWQTVSNLFYLLRSARSADFARSFIADLVGFAEVAAGGRAEVRSALGLTMADFEDALQVTAAIASNVTVIVSRNVRHFRSAPIDVQSPRDFLTKVRE